MPPVLLNNVLIQVNVLIRKIYPIDYGFHESKFIRLLPNQFHQDKQLSCSPLAHGYTAQILFSVPKSA